MRKVLLASAAVLGIAGTASAADLPRAYTPPPVAPLSPVAPLMNWTGFYIGVNAGGVFEELDVSTVAAPIYPGLPLIATSNVNPGNDGSFTLGGQVGFNWQIGSTVAGFEADIQAMSDSIGTASVSNSAVVGSVPVTSTLTSFASLDRLGTVRGRLGWLFTPQALVYGTGGLAYGETETSTSLSQTGTNGFVGFAYGVHSEWLWGWTIGAGLEWKFWSNASLKVEYLHYNLGSVTYTSVPTSAFFPNSIGTPLNHATSDFEGDIIRAGLNWQFNWGFPNVAAY